jgi:ABC-type antimicrobial peptide transport system permease subunit
VVAHVNQWGLDSDAAFPLHAQLYIPIMQVPEQGIKRSGLAAAVYVRTAQHGSPAFQQMRSRLLDVNGELVVYAPQSLEEVVDGSIAQRRFSMLLLAVFAGVALLLASVGIYGVLSYLVGQRTQEIGVRMALGAQRSDVLSMVLSDGARMTIAGVLVGFMMALALTRLMRGMLFGVKPTDPLTFFAVALLLCAIGFLACYLPARRATKVDPIVALRYE